MDINDFKIGSRVEVVELETADIHNTHLSIGDKGTVSKVRASKYLLLVIFDESISDNPNCTNFDKENKTYIMHPKQLKLVL